MSGHSKWATTKRAKGAADAKRANIFTKLARNITLAARDGADASMNFKLRLAVEKARAANMPKDNIERAIARGSGEGGGESLESITYEGFGPAGSAFVVEVVTDNRNRSAADIKHLFSTGGGQLGTPNSVSWMFDRVGGLKVTKPAAADREAAELGVIDAGATDVEWLDDDTLWVTTNPTELQAVKEALETAGFGIADSELGYHAKETLPVTDDTRPALEAFYDALDDADDVQNFWSNMAV